MFPHNPAAFPRPKGWNGLTAADEHSENDDQRGMDLRDWFAGQALVGVMVMRAAIRDQGFEDINQESIAEEAYELADAMLDARTKVA